MKLNKVETTMRVIAKRSWNRNVHGLPTQWINVNPNEQEVVFEDGSLGRYRLTSNLLGEPTIEEEINDENDEVASCLYLLNWFGLPTTWEELDAMFDIVSE